MDPTTPVVFLHAFPLNAAMWEGELEALGTRQAFAPNLPGFGGRPPDLPDVDRFAEVVVQDMDAEGISEAVVVGLSMGGYVALRLHARWPGRVSGLVLADTRAGPDDETGRARRTEQAARARREGIGWMPEGFLPALLGQTTLRERPGVVEAVRGMIADGDPEGVARALEAMRARPDSTPHLGRIRVPVLALVGEEDSLTPVAESRRIAGGVPEGSLVVVPVAGHLSNLEAPVPFREALVSFLARVDSFHG